MRPSPRLFALGLVLGVLIAAEVDAQPSPALDAYLCLKGAPSRQVERSLRFAPQPALAVRDRLIAAFSNTPAQLDLQKTVGFCLPAGAPGAALVDGATHLEMYAARLTRLRPKQPRLVVEPQRVTNRFGSDELLLTGIEDVLVPSAVVFAPPPLPVSVPATLDDFTCYAAERTAGLRSAPAAPAPVTLASGIGTLQFDVRAPVRVCFPADLGGADPSVASHQNALACYRAKLARTKPLQPKLVSRQVATANRFGSEQLTLTTVLEFCVPSEVHTSATPTPQATILVPTPTPTVTPPSNFTLRIDPAAVAVDIGTSAHFTATAVFENGDVADFTERVVWSTGSAIALAPNLAGDRGRIDAVDGGQTVIAVLDEATGVSSTTTGDDAIVTVNWTLERLELSPLAATRGVGESIRLRATGHFAGGYARTISQRVVCGSSDEAVALPSNAAGDQSRIVAVAAGTAVLSATDPISGVTSTASQDDVAITVVPALARCTILQTGPITIATAHDYQLTARGFYPGGFERNLTQQVVWSSNAPAILAAPNTEGDRSRVNALTPGEVDVTATDSVTGVACEGKVRFSVGAPTGFHLSYSVGANASRPKRVGRWWHLRASQSLAGSAIGYKYVTQKVVFASHDPSIAAAPNVEGDRGRIDAVGGGTALITATDPVDGSVTPALSLRVLAALSRVQVSFPDQPIGKLRYLSANQVSALAATGQFADGPAPLEAADVTLVSNNPAVVAVTHGASSWEDYWYMQGVGFGHATISAIDNATGISSDAFGESLRVAVPGPLQRIVLLPPQTTRRVGATQSFAAIGYFEGNVSNVVTTRVAYASSHPAVATTTQLPFPPYSSVVSAVTPGTSVISATDPATGLSTTDSGDDATLTVVGPLQRLRIEPHDVTRSVGRSFSLTAIGTDADGREINVTQTVTWSSSNPAVAVAANIDGNRSRVDTVGEGTTTISAFDPQDGISSTATGDDATLHVSGVLASLTLSAETTQITVGDTLQLTATGHLVGGGTINLTQQVDYASSAPAVATAENPPGDRSQIVAVSPGTAVLSAHDPGTGIATGPSGAVTVTVVAP